MAFAYLIDPENQFMTKSGTINVDGFLKVFDAATDDPAVTYKDFTGTENPERITLDNNGRAVVIADAERAYRLEVYDRYGTLMWTTTPLWCLPGGGGADMMNIISSDYSIAIDKTTVGSTTTFDLSVARDGTELLEWIKTEGYTNASGSMVPTYNAGTMEVGQRGIILYADRYYHVTARLATFTQLQPLYNEFNLTFKGIDAEDNVYTFRDDRLIIDCSTELHQDFEVSFDIIPETDIELYADVTGLAYGVSAGLTDVQVHRVYSGAPNVPGSVATRPWVSENYQEILSGGPGIELSGNYIAVDFDSVQEKLQEGTGIDIDGDTISVDFTEVQAKLEAGANIDITGNVISAIVPEYADADWDATSGEPGYIHNKPENLVQDADYHHTDNNFSDSDKSKLDSIEEGAQVNVNSDWDATSGEPGFIENKPTIPSGSQLVPPATTSDAGEVLTVDQNGVPEWAPAQAPISAGDGIDITNNVVSAKVDGTSVTFNANGELEATAEPQVQSDWAEDDPVDVSFIRNKPEQTSLVAGANITIVDDAQNNTVTISAASVSVPVQDVTIDNVSVVNAQGVAEIPRQVNADWNSSAGASEILNKPSIPVIGTITL